MTQDEIMGYVEKLSKEEFSVREVKSIITLLMNKVPKTEDGKLIKRAKDEQNESKQTNYNKKLLFTKYDKPKMEEKQKRKEKREDNIAKLKADLDINKNKVEEPDR